MGGKNHAPCKSYLLWSTEASDAFSELQAEFALANRAFEAAILADLHKTGQVTLAQAIEKTQTTINVAQRLDQSLETLLSKLDALAFQELPETPQVFDRIAADLAEIALRFDPATIATVNGHLKNGGFRSLFAHYRGRVASIATALQQVKDDFVELNDFSHDLVRACEENWTTIRLTYCRAQLLIGEFDRLWMYSSLASAEVWCENQGYDKLLVPATSINTGADILFHETNAVVA